MHWITCPKFRSDSTRALNALHDLKSQLRHGGGAIRAFLRPRPRRRGENFHGSQSQQHLRVFKGALKPLVNVGELNRDYAALVLAAYWQFWVWFMHARHERVLVCIDGQHGVTLD